MRIAYDGARDPSRQGTAFPALAAVKGEKTLATSSAANALNSVSPDGPGIYTSMTTPGKDELIAAGASAAVGNLPTS